MFNFSSLAVIIQISNNNNKSYIQIQLNVPISHTFRYNLMSQSFSKKHKIEINAQHASLKFDCDEHVCLSER